MNIIYKSRIGLIRFAKVFPFLLCFIVLISLSETLFALVLSDFVEFNGGITPNTPFSWLIANYFEFDIYSLILALVFAISFETCVYNKASIGYIAIFLGQQEYFPTIELYPEYIYAICITNIVITSFLCYKGVKQLIK